VKLQLLALLSASCISLPLLAQSTELDGASKVFEYALRISGSKATMIRSTDLTAISDPLQRKAVEKALSDYDEHQFTIRISNLIHANLTDKDSLECVSFIDSKIGRDLLNATQSATFQEETEKALSKLPLSYRAPITKFINSKCYTKTLQLSISENVMEEQRLYGTELVCRRYKDSLPQEFARAVAANYCKP